MQNQQILTDQRALVRHRARATAFFLHEELATEVQERLVEINKTFTSPAIVSAFPQIWSNYPQVIPENDTLALKPAAHDLLIHALSLHWANDPVGQLIQCRRALQPDGLFLGFLFGGQTLHELRACLAQAELETTGGLSPRILPMAEIKNLGSLLQRAEFSLPVADSFTKTVIYRDMFALMHDLRAMGEANALAGRLRHPTRRTVITRAAELYQQHHALEDGRIKATFEIIGLTGWAPHKTSTLNTSRPPLDNQPSKIDPAR